MSNAALSEGPAAGPEHSGPSDAMKSAASKTGRGGRADVRSSHPATGMEGPDASKAWRSGRADMGSSNRAPGMEASRARKARRNRPADVRNSGVVKLMKIAAAEAAVESAADKAGGDGGRARLEIGRDADAPGAKATPAKTNAGGADGPSAGAAVKLAGRDASA